MRLPLFIYHRDCFDGFASAWVYRQLVGDAEWHPASYRDSPPDVSGREVWIVDFSWPRAVMDRLALEAMTFACVDHHKTAEEALRGVPWATFDMQRSGCGLLWDVLTQGRICPLPRPRPWLVNYIEDRDLWRLSLPRVREVQAWISAQPFTFEAYDCMQEARMEACADKGAAIQLYIEQYGRKAREHTRVETVAGYSVPTVNLPYMNCSEHVGALASERQDAPFAAGYFRRADGRWQFSLRSRGDFDVSAVAKVYGGGGHAGAAGFDVTALPWEAA